MLVRSHTWLAFLSGIFASLASVFSKLAFGDNTSLVSLCDATIVKRIGMDCSIPEKIDVPFRALMVASLVVSNVLMWIIFSKAMSRSPTTVEVTIINTASNFLMSAWFGMIFFGETFSTTWYVGISLIIIGLAIIHRTPAKAEVEHSKKE